MFGGVTHVQLDDLRIFVTTVQSGTFTEAAHRLRMSQPNVSRAVQRMEDELSTRLLERSRPVVVPTRAGLDFLAFAQRTLADFDQLRASLGGATHTLRGTLQVVASTTPGEYLLPGLLAEYAGLYPDVKVQMQVINSDTVQRCVDEGHCDIGFLGRRPTAAGLTSHVVGADEIVLAVPAGHRLAGRESVSLADLEGEAVVEREAGSGTRQMLSAALQERGLGLPPHRVVLVASTVHSLLAAVTSGMGVGFVSSLALQGTDRRRVLPVRLSELQLVRQLYMVYSASRTSEACRAFAQLALRRCCEGGETGAQP